MRSSPLGADIHVRKSRNSSSSGGGVMTGARAYLPTGTSGGQIGTERIGTDRNGTDRIGSGTLVASSVAVVSWRRLASLAESPGR